MGRRRKKVVRLPKKRLPNFFLCPRCGRDTIKVNLEGSGPADVVCGNCGLKERPEAKSSDSPVDVYNVFIDKFYLKTKAAE